MSAFLAFVLLLCVMAATAEHELMHNMSCQYFSLSIRISSYRGTKSFSR